MSSEITKRQTTFWDIETPNDVSRIHFLGKEEFYFHEARVDDFSFHEQHPLLLEYQLPWLDLYISSSIESPSKVIEEVTAEWAPYLEGWRSPISYMTDTGPERMLAEGYGQFLSAPDTLVQVAKQILARHGVCFTILQGQKARSAKKVLLAGENYVIANEFRVEKSAT